MIVGRVNAFKEAIIPLQIRGTSGRFQNAEAVIDTGYSGEITVTPYIVEQLHLPFRELRSYELGDGELVEFAIHDAVIMWDEEEREIGALVTNGGVMVGMSRLTGYTLFIDAIDGGEVRIEQRG